MPMIHITAFTGDPNLPYRKGGESDAEYTDRLLEERRPGVFRQCSIGWHEECSDPHGEECACHCHKKADKK